MEYYLAIKNDNCDTSVGKWMYLENTLSEINQIHKLARGVVPVL